MKKISWFSALALLLVFSSCQAQENGKTMIQTEEYISLEKADSISVIDVRTPGEVSQGFISGTDYFYDVYSKDFAKNISALDKDKSYIVYCRSGSRSSTAINEMKKQGFTNLYELRGGIMSWSKPDLIEKK